MISPFLACQRIIKEYRHLSSARTCILKKLLNRFFTGSFGTKTLTNPPGLDRVEGKIGIVSPWYRGEFLEGEGCIILNPGSPSLLKGDERGPIGLIDSSDRSVRIIDLRKGNVLEYLKSIGRSKR